MINSSFVKVLSAAIAGITLTAAASFAQTMGALSATASAININNGQAGNIEIKIDRWSTDAQRDKLMEVMQTKGPEKLLDTLESLPRMGYFGATGNLGWDIHFARRTALPDGGERVVLITNRRVSFREEVRQPRSIDYPFTVIELRLNADGEGEGKMSIATKVIMDKERNTVTLENYETQPVQLTNVKRERSTR